MFNILRARRKKLEPLEVGTLDGVDSSKVIPVIFDPAGFMRHSIIFGQSGSGKSFSFGVILKELLMSTDVRIIVLDPNSDYKNFRPTRIFNEVKKFLKREYSINTHDRIEKYWNSLSVSFVQFGIGGDNKSLSISIDFSDLSRDEQALLLGFDLDRDREEYSVFVQILNDLGPTFSLDSFLSALVDNPSLEKIKTLYRVKKKELEDKII